MSNLPLVDNQELYETLLFLLGPILTLVFSQFSLKTWLRYEFFGFSLFAVLYVVYPQYILGYQTSVKLDSGHLFLCSAIACYFVYATLFQMFVSNKDESVYFGHFWARIIASTLIIVENLFAYYFSTGWNYKLLCFTTGNMIFDVVVNVYQLIKTKKPKSQNQFPDKVNYIAKIESYMLLVAGLTLYAFPDQSLFFLANKDNIHRSLVRYCGAFLFSLSFESFCVSEFLHLDDKKQFMLARFIGSLLELVVILLGFFHFKVYTEYPALAIFMFINTTYNLLVLTGYMITPRIRNTKVD